MNYTVALLLVLAFAGIAVALWYILRDEKDITRHFWKVIAALDLALLVGYLLLPPKLEFRYCLTLLGKNFALLLLRRFYQVPVAIPEVEDCAVFYETHTWSKPLRGVWDKL